MTATTVNSNTITQNQLDSMAAHITRMKHDSGSYWLDKKLYKRICGEIIRCEGELHEMTRLYEAVAAAAGE